MKTTITSMLWRGLGITLLVLLSQVQYSSGTANATLSTTACATGANYFEFQLNITNTSSASETLYINTPGTWRFNHGAGIVPTGTNTYSLTYISGTCDPILAPLFAVNGPTGYALSYTSGTRLMQSTFSNAVLGASGSAVTAPLNPGQTISAGKFRLTITNTNWVANTSVALTWVTTSGIVAYINSAQTTTALNTSTTRVLSTPCSMTTPQACSVTASTTSTNVSCFGGSNGSASVTGTGTSLSYLWSNGSTSTSISGLSAGSYSVTVTSAAGSGCSTSSSVTITQPSQLTASASAGSIACAGGSTSVTVSAAGGTAPYTGTGTFGSVAAGAE